MCEEWFSNVPKSVCLQRELGLRLVLLATCPSQQEHSQSVPRGMGFAGVDDSVLLERLKGRARDMHSGLTWMLHNSKEASKCLGVAFKRKILNQIPKR